MARGEREFESKFIYFLEEVGVCCQFLAETGYDGLLSGDSVAARGGESQSAFLTSKVYSIHM